MCDDDPGGLPGMEMLRSCVSSAVRVAAGGRREAVMTDSGVKAAEAAWWGLAVWIVVMDAISYTVPAWIGYFLVWGSILLPCGAVAAYKRLRRGWLLVVGLAVLAVVCGFYGLITGSMGHVTNLGIAAFMAIVVIWHVLVRMPRKLPAPAPQVTHVVHHHVVHGAVGAPETQVWAEPVDAAGERPALAFAPKAIEAPRKPSVPMRILSSALHLDATPKVRR
jgi:hypothetical protein